MGFSFPFVSRKRYEQEQDFSSGIERDLSALVVSYGSTMRTQEEEIASLKARLSSQEAAEIVAAALRDVAAATRAVAESFDSVKHSVGAAALSLDKAANVQREWLEISRGNR